MENAAFIFLNKTTSSQLKCDLLVDLNNAYHPPSTVGRTVPSTVVGGKAGTVDGGRWGGHQTVADGKDGGKDFGRWKFFND